MGFSYLVDSRLRVIEMLLGGTSTEAVLASEGICQASVYRWMRL